MTEKIYIGIDNERIEATGEVLQEILQREAQALATKAEQELKNEAASTAKVALLQRLGITVDEAALLLS